MEGILTLPEWEKLKVLVLLAKNAEANGTTPCEISTDSDRIKIETDKVTITLNE